MIYFNEKYPENHTMKMVNKNKELMKVHKKSGWELVDKVGNVFNRLVIYRGDYFHASLDYFGKDINDGRLFQTFFFNTEY